MDCVATSCSEVPSGSMESMKAKVAVDVNDLLLLLSYLWDDYLDEVNDRTRMALALDLVMRKENPKGDKVKGMTIATWDKIYSLPVYGKI
ncbi:hypothetical protein PIB30_013301 [Stylosanthes scabra]|uniref:Uncharacterized protein n=1 Tax=Stylosanthes scabra TaxID=79078 RepID=A0ABU6T633_9FABA|nr:hypothetical protein [Stylosanthes scabra]